MKDSRVSIWTNPTSQLTGSTTNTGPTLDLRQSYTIVGGTMRQVQDFGISVEIIQVFVSGDQTSVWEWEVSADDSTWRKGGFIGTVNLTAAGNATLRSNLETNERYVRLLVTNTGTGASTSQAWPEDFGSIPGTGAISNA